MYWKRNICHLAGASFEADRARAETVRNTHVVAISGRLEDRLNIRLFNLSSYQLIGFLRCYLIDVPAQLVHALNFTQEAISHRPRPFRDFAFDIAIFLASYIIDERADFLGCQQHVASSSRPA